MKRASISEAKNTLSALIDRVRRGERVIIEDRGVPIARLDSMATSGDDPDGRLARLERAGIALRPSAPVPRRLLATPPPCPQRSARLSQAVIDEREDGR